MQSSGTEPLRLAIIAGGGGLPVEAAAGARAAGHDVLVLGIAGEADLTAFPADMATAPIEWGQVGGMLTSLKTFGADKVILLGSISKRPDFVKLKLDWGAVALLPRILSIVLGGGDSAVLDKVAGLFAEKGVTLAGVHEVVPAMVAGEGRLAGTALAAATAKDMDLAAPGAWSAGYLDVGQGAVAHSGRLVAVEGAEGTDGMLRRVADMSNLGRMSTKPKAGCLAKCPRPQQDLRLDMPAIGPTTVSLAAAAGLKAILIEANHVLIAERERTLETCEALGVTLVARPRAAFVPPGQTDEPLSRLLTA
jgi:DUF1009 family protein